MTWRGRRRFAALGTTALALAGAGAATAHDFPAWSGTKAPGGFAWEVAGRIWYAAMNDARLRPNSRFTAFAQATIRAATAIGGGADSDATKAVTEAWRTVKVL